MSFPDPLLIDEIGLRLILQTRNEGQSSKKSFRLDGKDIPLKGSGTDVDAGLALTLVPCKLGLRCDSTEFATAIQCATGGDCDDGRGDALRKAFENNQKAPADLFVRTDQLADRIANALLHKQKNVLSD